MGYLAFQLAFSVRIFKNKHNRYDRCCNKIPLKAQKLTVCLVSVAFGVGALALMIKGDRFWINITNVKIVDPNGKNNNLRDGLLHNSAQIATILFTLSFFLILYYSHMRYILNKYFSNAL